METRVFGNLVNEALEVVQRNGHYFLRYDAGTQQMAWREDELSVAEFEQLRQGRPGEYSVILELQRRIRARGEDPHVQNWSPPTE